jgi:hypothetical protein
MSLYRYYFPMGHAYILEETGPWRIPSSFLFSFLSIIPLEILHCALVPSHSKALFAKHIFYTMGKHQGGAE